jgi:TonB family protein
MRFVGLALIALLMAACTLERQFIPNARRDYRACTTYEACILVVHGVVSMNWIDPTPAGGQKLRAVLTVKLDEDAKIMGVSVARSSGNYIFDESALTAVHRTGDFQELMGLDPAAFEKNFREFNLDFSSIR